MITKSNNGRSDMPVARNLLRARLESLTLCISTWTVTPVYITILCSFDFIFMSKAIKKNNKRQRTYVSGQTCFQVNPEIYLHSV